MRQNYPNPFTTSTTITYVLERPARRVVLQVFDALGRAVATLVDGPASAGVHDVPFDAAGLAGRVYFIRLGGDAGAVSQTMVLVR